MNIIKGDIVFNTPHIYQLHGMKNNKKPVVTKLRHCHNYYGKKFYSKSFLPFAILFMETYLLKMSVFNNVMLHVHQSQPFDIMIIYTISQINCVHVVGLHNFSTTLL